MFRSSGSSPDLSCITYVSKRSKFVLISWDEASQLCGDIGGFLPYFTSRTELEELIALLKISQHIGPVERMFIGLSIRNETVSKFILVF